MITALLAMGWGGMAAQYAAAEPNDDIELFLPAAGETHDGQPVYNENADFRVTIGYGWMTPGSTSELVLPEGFVWPAGDGPVEVPAGNDAISGIVVSGQSITFTWAEPWPEGVIEGVFNLDLKVDATTESQVIQNDWSLAGQDFGGGTIIVREDGDQFENVQDAFSKRQTWTALSEHISVTDGVVSIADGGFDVELPYEVFYSSTTDRTGLTITDTGGVGLVPVAGTGTVEVISWDENGLNRTTATSDFTVVPDGKSFSHTLDVAANTEVRLRYTARLDIAERAEITALLQADYDRVSAITGGGDWGANLRNTATTSEGDSAFTDRWIHGGNSDGVWGPGYGDYVKADDAADQNRVEWADDEDKTLTGPVTVNYTINANLTQWDGSIPEKVLSEPIIISDNLPTQGQWVTTDSDWITYQELVGGEWQDRSLTEVPAGEDARATINDAAAHSYVLDGQQLYVNVGTDANHYRVIVRAQITHVEGLHAEDRGGYAENRRFRNRAEWFMGTSTSPLTGYNNDTWLHQYYDVDNVVDEGRFDKQGPNNELIVRVGESADVPFTFVVGAGVGDVSDSVLTDHVNHDVFNVTEDNLDEIRAALRGHVDWWPELAGNDFDLVLNADGDLEITLSDAGIAKVQDAGKSLTARYQVTITLPTHVFDSKSTLDIANSATYAGESTDLTFVDSVQTQATTYGNELELQKQVFNPAADAYTPNLRVELDDEGNMAHDEFVYRIRIMPHGQFNNMIRNIVDVLPAGVEFVGFVDSPTGPTLPGNTYTLPGSSLQATYDGDRSVTITRGSLTPGQNLELQFRVRVLEFTEDVGIRNVVGPATATIVPTNGYPLDINKIDADDNEVLITDTGARFEVRAAESGELVSDEVYVIDGKLVTPGDDGAHKALLVSEPGSYEIRELIAPDGYELLPSGTVFTATVGADGSTRPVNILNDPLYYAVGDYVWIDTDRNGIQDTDEAPLPGVTVNLLDGTGAVVGTTTTDSEGRYLFDNLRAGDYQVRFTLTPEQAERYKFTETGHGTADDDSNAVVTGDVAIGETPVFTLNDDTDGLTTDYEDQPFTAPQGIDPTWDAGVVLKTYAIGDYVWIDSDNDGVQDEDEEPLPGVTVELLDSEGGVVRTTTTNAEGRYVFDEVPAGEYQVRFILSDDQSAEYYFTSQDSEDDDAADSDANPVTGVTALFTLDGSNTALTTDYEDQPVTATEGIDPTWDAGVVRKTYAVGDYVWIDADRDGLQGDDELPLEGVTVELLQGGVVIDSIPTDAEGRYLFDNLPAGDYQVRFTLTEDQSAVYNFTTRDAGGDDDTADSDAGLASGTTQVFRLDDNTAALTSQYDRDFNASQGVDPTWDAGVVVKTYAVGDVVWVDENRDGLQGDSEVLEGVTVELLDGEGEVIATTTTDEDGRYLFDNLLAGEYQVKFTLTDEQAALYNFTTQDAGDDSLDSDADPATGLTVEFVLDDSNPSLTKEYTDQTVLASEGIDPTWDAGVVRKTYAVGDVVWVDDNRDGLQGDSEVLVGVTVDLLDGEGNLVATTTTGEDGRYLFDNLLSGDYQVRFTLTEEQAALYNFTTQNAGDDALDSDADPVTGTTVVFTLDGTNPSLTKEYTDQTVLASEGIDPTWDAGVVRKTYAVGDVVWIDEDGDGVQGDEELPLVGVTVELLDSEGEVIATETTDEAGRYLFDNLLAGDYQVRFTLTEEQQLVYNFTSRDAGDDSLDSDADPATGLTVEFVLDDSNPALTKEYTDQTVQASEGIDPTWDAGVVRKTYAVGDVVWVDDNRDGLQGDSEVLVGVTVELLDGEGNVVGSTTTGEDGRYLFDNLLSGDYQVRFTLTEEQAALYNFTTQNAGDDALDSDADPVTGTTVVFTLDGTNPSLTKEYTDQTVLASEGIDPMWDAGVVRKTYAVGDVVWIDEDGDGVQGDDEEPLAGVTVELLDSEGNVVASTTTDEDGRYLIDEIPSGEYQIRFTLTPEQQEKYSFTTPNSGENDGVDSDSDGYGLTPKFVLDDNSTGLTREYDREYTASEGVDPTWDAGVVLNPIPDPTPTPEPTQEPTPAPEPTPTSSEAPSEVEAPKPGLPDTGGFGDLAGIAGILAALLVMGAGIMFVRARRMV